MLWRGERVKHHHPGLGGVPSKPFRGWVIFLITYERGFDQREEGENRRGNQSQTWVLGKKGRRDHKIIFSSKKITE